MAMATTVEGKYNQSKCGSVKELLLFSTFEMLCNGFLKISYVPAKCIYPEPHSHETYGIIPIRSRPNLIGLLLALHGQGYAVFVLDFVTSSDFMADQVYLFTKEKV